MNRWDHILEEICPQPEEIKLIEILNAILNAKPKKKVKTPGMVQIAPGKWRSKATPW